MRPGVCREGQQLVSADSFEFERNEGAFTGRQHIVNHVDMILGLGSDFHSSFRKGRLVHACDTKHGIDYTTSVAKLAENELSDGRNWLLGQCAYAMRRGGPVRRRRFP